MNAKDGRTGRGTVPIRGWFAGADAEFRRAFLALGRPKSYSAGSTIYQAGDAGPDVFGVRAGVVMLHCRFVHPDAVMLHMLHAGDWVGTAPVLVDRPRRVTAVARTDVEVLRIPGDELRALMDRRPEWIRELARDVVHYLDLAMQGSADLLIRSPAGRCAAVLLRLGGRRWAAYPDANLPAEIPAAQAELAMLSNVSRNTFGRVVSAFAARGFVQIHYKSLTIVDPVQLREIADGG
jgi:CRP-like cAMP-binding protein